MLLIVSLRDISHKLKNNNEILRQWVNIITNLILGLVVILVILLPFLTIKYVETL